MTQEEKIKSIKGLFWDYVVDPQETLRHIEAADIDEISLRRLFVRCFERLKWDDVVDIWGIDRCLDMEGDEVRRMIRPQLRDKYDRIYAALHRKPIPLSRQDIEDIRRFIAPLLSHRWYCAQ